MTKSLPALEPHELEKPLPERQTIIDRDRRRQRRVRLELETAVPALVRSERGVQRGLVRNISDGGMMIELASAPSIGSLLEVELYGSPNSRSAPEPVVLHGEVRHQINWNFKENDEMQTLQAIGVRFVTPTEPTVPPGTPIH